MAKNKRIVEWVNQMVNFHRIKSEEKALLDIILSCIYSLLFPGGANNITKLLIELQKFVIESSVYSLHAH
jgi:hypothetical protein